MRGATGPFRESTIPGGPGAASCVRPFCPPRLRAAAARGRVRGRGVTLKPAGRAPAWKETDRFPGRQEVRDAISANERYRDWLEVQLSVRPHDQGLADAQAATRRAGLAWNALDEWQRGFHVAGDRADLRCALGDAAFFAGQMPEPVPTHYLPEKD